MECSLHRAMGSPQHAADGKLRNTIATALDAGLTALLYHGPQANTYMAQLDRASVGGQERLGAAASLSCLFMPARKLFPEPPPCFEPAQLPRPHDHCNKSRVLGRTSGRSFDRLRYHQPRLLFEGGSP